MSVYEETKAVIGEIAEPHILQTDDGRRLFPAPELCIEADDTMIWISHMLNGEIGIFSAFTPNEARHAAAMLLDFAAGLEGASKPQ
jgi:hypothetical protein